MVFFGVYYTYYGTFPAEIAGWTQTFVYPEGRIELQISVQI